MIIKIFTKNEIRDILISTLIIAFILAYPNFEMLLLYLIVVVFGFVLHELAHKFTAMKFHCAAFYQLYPLGLLLGLVLMFIGFKVIAPGAVVIFPYTFGRWGFRTKRLTVPETGIIALSGPATNLFIALIFAMMPLGFARIISFTNAWLAFFNLLPIPPLDGSKVVQWKAWLWIISILFALMLMYLA